MIKPWITRILLVFIFLAGSILYTWPGPLAIWESRSDIYMSDGTDQTTAPFLMDALHEGYHNNPLWFFYGGFPNSRLNAPEGYVSWFSVSEKMAAFVFPYLVPIEQVGVLLAILLLAANGLAFYGMARSLGWSRGISLALSMAWAFSAYTRARAQVHIALAGVYIAPLAIWGLAILQKDRSPRSLIKSSLCFLGCATSSHYYLIFMAMFSPFLLMFYYSSPGTRNQRLSSLTSLLIAVFPAALFLSLSFFNAAPADFQKNLSSVLPSTGQSSQWPHPFVNAFSANLKDYFTGDIAIGENDINPLRNLLTEQVRKEIVGGNFHEHALGIRWFIWIAFFAALCFVLKKPSYFSHRKFEGGALLTITFLGVFSLLTSLPPDWGFIWGPSAWIHKVVSQIRVPNRAGIFFHFSVLIFIGIAAHQWASTTSLAIGSRKALVTFFTIFVILDFPPFLNPMPMARALPSRAPQISQKPGACGLGYHFPHISGDYDPLRFYYLLQSFRGTDCAILNPAMPSVRDQKMNHIYGYHNKKMFELILQNDPLIKNHLVEFARCNRLDWLSFDQRLPEKFVQDVCDSWGGTMVAVDLCRNKTPSEKVPNGLPDECLNKLVPTN